MLFKLSCNPLCVEVNFKNLLSRNSCESKSLCSTEKKPGLNRLKGKFYSPPALGRKPEEVIASDLVASSFPTDVGEGGVNLIFPLVAVEYVYLGRQYTRMEHVYP